MELIVSLVGLVLFVLILMYVLCGWLCKRRHRGNVFGIPTSGRTLTIITDPPNQHPVYIDENARPPPPGFNVGTNRTAPCYPIHPAYPQQAGDAGAPPPSYYEAMAQQPQPHPHPNTQQSVINEGYAKQSPYNPHY